MTLAVFHATTEVGAHIAALRRARRFRLACLPPRSASLQSSLGANVVLWELAPGHKPNRRQIQEMVRHTPVVSYSAGDERDFAELSRVTGFASHLRAPLQPVDVEHRLALTAPFDLATKLSRFQSILHRHLRQADVLVKFVRDVNAPAEPTGVAEVLLVRAIGWLPVPTIGIVATDDRGVTQILARHQLAENQTSALTMVGAWVLREGRDFVSADLSTAGIVDSAPALAVLGFPLNGISGPVGALVGAGTGVRARRVAWAVSGARGRGHGARQRPPLRSCGRLERDRRSDPTLQPAVPLAWAPA